MSSSVSSKQSSFYQPATRTPAKTSAKPQERQNPYHEPDMLAACRTGNIGWVEELLVHNPGYENKLFRSGATGRMAIPMYAASQCGHDKVVELLLQKGTNPNSQCMNGYTPLHMASLQGHTKIVQLLLQADAKPDISNNDGVTPLFIAIENNHKDVVEILLQANANPNISWRIIGSLLTKSPLLAAKRIGNKEIIALVKTAIEDRKIKYATPICYQYNAVSGVMTELKTEL